jgi:hypothetical protein
MYKRYGVTICVIDGEKKAKYETKPAFGAPDECYMKNYADNPSEAVRLALFGMIMRTPLFVGPREDPKVYILLPLYFECTKCIEVESECE